MPRMGLPTLLDHYFPTHANWTALSLGWVSTIWLSAILSRGDHRMVHVEPWVAQRFWTLGGTTGRCAPSNRLLARHNEKETMSPEWSNFKNFHGPHTVSLRSYYLG